MNPGFGHTKGIGMLHTSGLILTGLLLCVGAQVGNAAAVARTKQNSSQTQKRKAFAGELQEKWVKACKENNVQISMILEAVGPGAKELVAFEGKSWNSDRMAVVLQMQKKMAELGFTTIVFAQPRQKTDSSESLYVFRDNKTANKHELTAFSIVKLKSR